WYKLGSNRQWYMLGSTNGHRTNETGLTVTDLRVLPRGPNPEGLCLSLDRLTGEAEGIYKCVVRRIAVNYYDSQLVSIMLK
ncbi:Hypothetical predicted protein, partial [Paramuricea clavata]